MGRWLGRFSFSLLAIGFVLAWEGYRMNTGEAPGTPLRMRLHFAGAVVCVILSLLGAHQRHRRQP